jgi:hypothetical protein
MELQALSLLRGANVYVYQEGQPRWSVSNHPDSAPALHLSYHGGEHYNSVGEGEGQLQGGGSGAGPGAAAAVGLAHPDC